ncbi:MAG TPA: hypothetical protein DCS43_16925 [Verrucomicrobia bacterium]|nr:hypothetical protein [Verrucomicrobiota bacterium]
MKCLETGRIGHRGRVLLSLVSLLVLVAPGFANHQATLHMKVGNPMTGVVRYIASSKSYEIKAGSVTRQVPAADVSRVVLAQPPAGLDQAVKAVNSGNFQAPIQTLTTIVKDYAMFGPDVVAGNALAKAYLGSGRPKEALKACDDLIRVNPESMQTAAFAGLYWDILLQDGTKGSALRSSLRDAVETGNRELAAMALIRRGDLEMKDKKFKEALVDGYLRAILLFQDVNMVQPEALYKAIKAHEALNEVQLAERWRKKLLSGYANSEFASKLK